MLEVKNISYKIGTKQILENISASFLPGKLSMIIGPNGSGKSTLLKIISNEIEKYSGEVFYNNRLLTKKDNAALAKIRAVLSQQSELSFPLTVEEVVMMGRYPHFDFKPTRNDLDICLAALREMNILDFRYRNYLTLSGGEKQRVHFARVLAQIWEKPSDTDRYLFLDEPISHLDLNYQHEFLKQARFIASGAVVVIVVIHDVNLAIQYADKVLALNNGKVVIYDVPSKVIKPEIIDDMYNIKSKMIKHPDVPFPILIAE